MPAPAHPSSPYDSLAPDAQARERERWIEETDRRLATLDLSGELRAAGVPWPEADPAGRVVIRT